MKSYLDFYEKHNVIPVKQVLSPEHALRRTHLYREIGCPPIAFKNSKVLEVGPGTGDNAVITSKFEPKEFWLIDGNSASCTELSKKIQTGLIKNATLMKMDIMSMEFENLNENFDIIICEGASAQQDPKEFYRKILTKANKSDALVIFSCSSALSTGSELLRMLWYEPLSKMPYQEAVNEGAKVFGKHLKTLKGVSRTSSDWVIDSILNPKPKGFSFDISDLLELATEEGFQFLGSSSPNFFQNYDWYKQFDSQNSCSYNKKVKSSWERQVLCTLDTRINPEDIAQIMKEDYSLANEVISSFTNLGEVITNMYASPENKLEAKLVESSLERIIQSMRHDSLRRTRQSVIDLGKVINNILEGQIHEDTGSFKEFWGRGQQYVSLVRSKFLDQ